MLVQKRKSEELYLTFTYIYLHYVKEQPVKKEEGGRGRRRKTEPETEACLKAAHILKTQMMEIKGYQSRMNLFFCLRYEFPPQIIANGKIYAKLDEITAKHWI